MSKEQTKTNRGKTLMLVEGALMLALAIVLSLVTPFKKLLPFGGSITLLSMLPICIYSIKYGILNGLGVSFLFSIFQLVQGIVQDGLLGWGLTPAMLIGCILFDYVLAYTVIGLAGIFRHKGTSGQLAGIILALVLRFFSHFLSGVVIFASAGKIWDELDFVASNKYVYSAVYNGAYMLPEIILTAIGAALLLKLSVTKSMVSPR